VFEVQRGANRLYFAAGGDGDTDRGSVPEGGVAEATFYNWRKKYTGLMPSEMKRLKQLEEENGKLKQLVADLSLDKAMLQDVLKRNVWSGLSLQGFR
jgi:putative transposase